MKKLFSAIGLLLLAALAYLAAWPVPVEPVAWVAPPAPGYRGAHAPNDRLAGLTPIDLGGEEGPEHVAIGPDGWVYTGVASGRILRIAPDGGTRETYADTGGRVLGIAFDAAGELIAADAVKGLLAIGSDRRVRVLADRVAGAPILFADAVVVGANGRIYFSAASMRFGAAQWHGTFDASVLDIIEQRATGRVLEYDPATRTLRVVARGLSFANGLALSADERSLFVAETGRYRVWRIAIDARDLDVSAASAQARIVLDNLPGFPDNLMRGRDGRIWVGFTGPRNPTVDSLADKPWLRKVAIRLPKFLQPLPKVYGHVAAFTEDGRIVEDLQDPGGAYPQTSGATEAADRIWIHSLSAKTLAFKRR